MIISRTPFRMSFAGGGTDLHEFYSREGGAVISTSINQYMYIAVNRKFDDTLRISYSQTENPKTVADVEHPIVREALKLTGITKGIEITSVADIPAKTGLGSSSAFTVGLLNALYAYKGEYRSPKQLAEEACHIEIELCKEPIGKQDQYIAAYGGLQHIQFNQDSSVFVDPLICSAQTRQDLEHGLVLFYTGVNRQSQVLHEQKENTVNKIEILKNMKNQVEQIKEAISKSDLETFGRTLDEGWKLKQQLAGGITNPDIDAYYKKAIEAGAYGGKLLGAGGGGFLLFYCPPEKQDSLRSALLNLRETTISLEPQGSKILHVSD